MTDDLWIFRAARAGRVDVVREWIKQGGNSSTRSFDGSSLAHAAASLHDDEMMSLLLASGVHVDLATVTGSTALHVAAISGAVSAGNALLQYGANLNAIDQENGYTPLHFAVECKRNDFVSWLMEKGADISVESNDGMTALDLAKASRNIEAIGIISDTKKWKERLGQHSVGNLEFDR